MGSRSCPMGIVARGSAWCAAALVAACGSSGGSSTNPDAVDANSLVVMTWWEAVGEIEGLQALEVLFKRDNPGVGVSKVVGSPELRAEKIGSKVWDAVLFGGGDLISFSRQQPYALTKLDNVYEEEGLNDDQVMTPEIRQVVTISDHPIGVVTGVQRNNAFFCNKAIFDREHLTCPTTLEDFFTVAEQLKTSGARDGYLPVAQANPLWCARLTIDEIMAAVLGPERFVDLATNRVSPTDASVEGKVREGIDLWHELATGYIDGERFFGSPEMYNWDEATQDFHDGKAAMMFHGDWAAGYLIANGSVSGRDFVAQGPPGAADFFVYGADTLTVPASVPHPEWAGAFLRIVASKEGQLAFNSRKGSVPMRIDVRDLLDEDAKGRLDAFTNAKVKLSNYVNAVWDRGMERYQTNRNKTALLSAYLYGTVQ